MLGFTKNDSVYQHVMDGFAAMLEYQFNDKITEDSKKDIMGSVMSSFNIVDGIPATANKWLLTDLLRDEWGFGGLLVTDYNSIAEMSSHGVAPLKEASIRALQAGTDMDMVSCGFLNTLEESLKEGKVTEEQINAAVATSINPSMP